MAMPMYTIDDEPEPFDLENFLSNNSSSDPEDLADWKKDLEGLAVGASVTWNFGAGGITTVRRVS
jgi:hypothetical protein